MTPGAGARAAGPALLAALLLSGCVQADRGQSDLCIAALPALEPDGHITVAAAGPVAGDPRTVSVAYGVEQGGRRRTSRLDCRFAGDRLDDDRLDLAAVAIDGRPLSGASLVFLKRFWLGDPVGQRAEARRLDTPPRPPLIAAKVGPDAGYLLQQLVTAAPLGAIYGLIALAYAFVYGLIGRINLAFGEIAVVGAVATVNLLLAVPAAAIGGVAAAVAVSLVVAAVASGALGRAIDRLVFRPLSTAGSRSFLIATIGLSLAIAEALRLMSRARDSWIQPILNDPVPLIGGGFPVTATPIQGLETAAGLATLAAVTLLMTRTGFGRRWRAVADDPLMARFLGIDPLRVAAATLVLSGALAGIAGGLTALHYGHASPSAGLMIGLKALVAALLGGIGSLSGAALGGLAIGLAETLWSAYLPIANRDIAVLLLLVFVLVLRPDGLFGRARPDRDASDARWTRHA